MTFAPFRSPGTRFAAAVCPSYSDALGEVLAVVVADPEGHPFDLGPQALLDVARVRELHAYLGEWLTRVDGR